MTSSIPGLRGASVPELRAIRLLDEQVAGRIAAGEVIDRPFSIVRELLDNAIDAGADEIDVELHSGGLGLVAVRDNGHGISRTDLDHLALRHATSKIVDERDLQRVTTLGFRGEALASIAACARLEVISRPRAAPAALRLVASSGGRQVTGAAAAAGTRVQVTRLFADLPARRRFLRRPGTETALCRRMLLEKALAHPEVTFRLTVDGGSDTALPSATPLQRVADALGGRVAPNDLFQAQRRFADFHVTVIGARPELAGRDRSRLMVFVNRRRIQQFGLAQAVEYGYAALLPGGRHPVALSVRGNRAPAGGLQRASGKAGSSLSQPGPPAPGRGARGAGGSAAVRPSLPARRNRYAGGRKASVHPGSVAGTGGGRSRGAGRARRGGRPRRHARR